MSRFTTKNRTLGNITIALLFAILHFGVAIVTRQLDYYDDIPLTVLTITMVIVISMRNNTRVELMAILTLVATILGFIIGSWLQSPMLLILNNESLAPAVATLLISFATGSATDYLTRRISRSRTTRTWEVSPRSVVIVALSILVLRILYVILFRAHIFTEGLLFSIFQEILTNSWAILLLLVGNIILTIQLQKRITSDKRPRINLVVILGTILIPILCATIIYYDIPLLESPSSSPMDFLRITSAALLIDILVVTICYLVLLSLTSKRELRYEREQKHRTEYQYERLKQQINPHFLFNSLGILDYLVQEHETERASAFIRKLANIYRYMLNNDQKTLVKLGEELNFTAMYIDLLKERFAEGMIIEYEIEPSLKERYVVPCSLQLLVENATKHNIVESDQPLRITVMTEGNMLVVRNNLQMRRHGQPSTHLGLENIRQQYRDITRRDIMVQKTDSEFIVKIPIV